jgi:ABC-2 type transport system permease protein
MTAATSARPRAGHYRFGQAARMEWIKLRSLRSTWWTLAITAAGAIGIAVAVGANTKNASGDLTNNALAGISVGLLTMGVLGVLVMTGEYSSGSIRSTLVAIPNRPLLLAAKATVFGAVALAVGELAAFVAFFAGNLALPASIAAPTLGQPGVLRAVGLSGVGFCLIGLLGLGLGAIIRHSPAAIGVLVGGVYVVAQLVAGLAHAALAYIPVSIVANSLGTTKPLPVSCDDGPCPHVLSAWTGLGVLSLYAAVALAIGGWLLVRRDV